MSIRDLQKFLDTMTLTKQQQFIGERVLKEIRARVGFLVDVGLEYLSLARATATLSGGEAQRIRLATRSVPDWWVYAIFWTSPASACTREIMTNC